MCCKWSLYFKFYSIFLSPSRQHFYSFPHDMTWRSDFLLEVSNPSLWTTNSKVVFLFCLRWFVQKVWTSTKKNLADRLFPLTDDCTEGKVKKSFVSCAVEWKTGRWAQLWHEHCKTSTCRETDFRLMCHHHLIVYVKTELHRENVRGLSRF